jgi:NADPH:quinone reductase
MRAWLLEGWGGVTGLRLAELPPPTPQAGEVVLRLRFAAVNPADRYLAERQYPATPPLPHVLGRDGMGTVVALGPGVTEVALGERRLVLRGEAGVTRPGTFAEQVAVPADGLVEPPPGWSDIEAGGAALVYLTAYQALTAWPDVPAASVVLVTGASGGVGVAAVQLARALGHEVVALSRSEGKRARLRDLGAGLCLDPSHAEWRSQLERALAPRRVALAIDSIGGSLLPEVIGTLADCGRVSLVGRLAGPVPSFNTATLFFRRIRMAGIAVGAYAPAQARAAWRAIVALLEPASARPVVDSILPFARLPEAFSRLAAGPMGTVVLAVGAP